MEFDQLGRKFPDMVRLSRDTGLNGIPFVFAMAYCIGSGRAPDGVSAVYQLVLPKARIHQVLEELHNSPTGGHFGVTRTLASKENQERSLPEFVKDLRERLDRIHRFASEKLKMHSDK
ncbi:hypothetical protein NQ318_004637 [Aromia moschata]|uniref:Integrase zinc-binding domain-containing protein n=1 Tax=Aromia moschata TaxID=1265417 RepID=A0AAV8Y4A1_9CUCU|nr:hypothetical protein NQ318_004637 [Aromia moschata]